MTPGETVWRTIIAEFSDLRDETEVTRICVRLLLAALLGGVLGYEREQKGKTAGLRTHMLVAVGSALFILTPVLAGADTADISRVLQGLLAGIGFLGAGAIIKNDGQKRARGLTTAAGLWLTAAIGVSVGIGRVASAVLCTGLALVILALLPKLERRVEDENA